MFVYVWITLLLSVRGSSADTGASAVERQHCLNGFCITLIEGELTAETGLCVVIPCSFTTGVGFRPTSIAWFKCEPSKSKCTDSDLIFHSNKNKKFQSGFKGRVSVLVPYVWQKNCSIMINDLRESDSGSYQLRVNGLQDSRQDGFSFPQRATVIVKDLNQKPTVDIPPMTEGQQTTLTCTAPGLCSGSDPKFTWMWRGAGENDSHITGNITAFSTEELTAVTRRHSSTLTFNPSAEHHSTNITCKISFTGNTTTQETLTLNVTYVKQGKITGDTSVKEGETLNLTCSVESFPPSLITWTKLSDHDIENGTETNLQVNTSTDLQNETKTLLQEDGGVGTFSIPNVTAEDSGQYICTATHLDNSLTQKVNVTVMYKREPRITGDTTLKEGDVLNLTCSVESFPPSLVTWSRLPTQHNSSNTNLHNGSDSEVHDNTGSSTLIIYNVTTEHSGQYICTTEHLDTTVTSHADVVVTWFSKIQNGSGCVVQSELLTCACISEGFPLPTIRWPLLMTHAEYSVLTSVSNHTVNSTVTLAVKNYSRAAVECVSSSENEEAKENLTIRTTIPEEGDPSQKLLEVVSKVEIIIAFFIGVLLSAIICCLATKCRRKQQKSSGNMDETLEMMTSQDEPLIYDEVIQDDQTHVREEAENGAVVAGETVAELSGSKDVEYANINFSLLNRKSARMQENTKTEYAEIKKVKEEMEGDGGEEGEMLEGREEEEKEEEVEEEVVMQEVGEEAVMQEVGEEEVMQEVGEETEPCVPYEDAGESDPVYSTMKDIKI